MDDHSVTDLLCQAKRGNARAAAALCERYYPQLIPLAKRKLRSSERRVADEEDVINHTLLALLDGIADNRFSRLGDRDDLWQVLLMLTARNATSQRRRMSAQRRGGGKNRGESAFGDADERGGINNVLGESPTPEFAAEFVETLRGVLELFDPETRGIVLLRLEGFSAKEIAERVGKTERSVHRDLLKVRLRWEKFS